MENAVLLEQIVNDSLLLSADPTREQQKEEDKRCRQRIHTESGSVPKELCRIKDSMSWPPLGRVS